jgi:cytochrome c-type biogenesis protein CcmH
MTGFVVAAALLTLAALGFVLWPLLRTRADSRQSRRQANLTVYRDQFAELERDLKLGTLDATRYESARSELERRLLDEVGEHKPVGEGVGRSRSARYAAVAIALALPVCAALLYLKLGQPEAMRPPKRAGFDPATITVQEFEALTRKLADKLARNPDDPTGWLMLGRAYKAMERYPDAVKALSEANKRDPDNAAVLVELAEAMALANGQNLAGEPTRLLDRALKLKPDDQKALTLAGTAAFARGDYHAAIGYWQRLRKLVPPQSELAQAVDKGIDEARMRAAGKPSRGAEQTSGVHAEAIRGEIRLAVALKSQVNPDDNVFVFVRAVEGPRVPLAVIKRQARDLPLRFQLDDSQAMAPELKLSGFSKVIVSARVSKSGSAAPQAGDLQGASGIVRPGTRGVVVTIDSVVP